MAQQYISDELGATITNKWVFSIAPVPVGAESQSPYNCMNHSKTAMQLRLSEVGGERVVFNMTWPQFDTLKRAVNKAQENITMEKNKKTSPFFWELSDSAGDDNFVRIFGDPDNKGLCPVRKLVIRRQPMRKNSATGEMEWAKSPWYIEIASGKGRKLQNKTGGYYMDPKSYVEINRVHCNLSDGRMKEHVFWGEFFMDIFESAVKDSVLKGYNRLLAQKEDFKRRA